MSRLDEINARCEAATAGPWEAAQGIYAERVFSTNHKDAAGDDFVVASTDTKQDADFIAHAREDMPWAISELVQARKERDWHKEMYNYAVDEGNKLRDALAQYREAEEDGLLVRLPCKVGDTVFDICDGTAYETKVLSFSVLGSHVACRTVSSHPNVEQFGTRIFLTHAEAEQALRGDKQDV